MGELETLARAVEELHETDRLIDLLLTGLAREHAPPEVIEQFQRGQLAYLEWQQQ